MGGKRVPDGPQSVTRAVWEPFIAASREEAEELFYDVQRIISDPSRKTSRNGAARHDFTSTIKCDVCGGQMNARMDGDRQIYTCIQKSCVRVGKDDVDLVVKAALFGYLARPGLYEMLAAPSSDDANVRKIRADLAAARANLAEMEAATPESLFESRTLARSVEALSGKIAGLETQERELTMPAALAGILAPGTDVAQWWGAAPVSARREVARIVLSPGLLGEVRIKRAVRTGSRYTPAAERIVWRRDAT